MLSLQNLSLSAPDGTPILSNLTTTFPSSHLAAIIGPSGCGKSSLLKTIAGFAPGADSGDILWHGRNLAQQDFAPTELGYVPQFNIIYPQLTPRETIAFSLRLRLAHLPPSELLTLTDHTLTQLGLADLANTPASSLSGGQLRRLSLAAEICHRPPLLLCDEVTSGLDPRSELEILQLLRAIPALSPCLILAVTHGIEHLHLFDSILVLYSGHLAYHGPPRYLTHYFRIDHASQLYDQLTLRPPEAWAQSWHKHHASFLQQFLPPQSPSPDTPSPSQTPLFPPEKKPASAEATPTPSAANPNPPPLQPHPTPPILRQTLTLLHRRYLLLSRDPHQLALHLGLILGFPLIVALFAWDGLPAVRNLSLGLHIPPARQHSEALAFLADSSKIGTLVSGIVMLQVILLTLVGANNSAREISAHRQIIEKEKLSGLNPTSLLLSQILFLLPLLLAQSLWMGLFVHYISHMPGNLHQQLLFLTLSNAAMSALCLAISAWLDHPEKSTLVSIYLVGFQLPLSGAILALPEPLGSLIRPFIAAYWGWSGYLQSLRDERYFDIVTSIAQTPLAPQPLCTLILLTHVLIGLYLAWLGLRRLPEKIL